MYVLLVSEVLDHDAQCANMLLNQVLATVRGHDRVNWSAFRSLCIAADCGPHFRSYESVAHYCFTLVKTLQVKVQVLYLGEQHGKGSCDRLFGWTNVWLKNYIQLRPVHGITDLVDAYKQGGAKMMSADPTGPVFVVGIFEPGEVRPNPRFALACPCIKITRTYSLSAELNRYAASGVTMKNNVFSDLTATESLHPWKIDEIVAEEPEHWRRGYYDKPRAWESVGPQAGDVNEVTRKHSAQKTFLATAMPRPKRSIEEKLSAKARALSRQAAKKRRQMAEVKKQAGSDNASGSSSSSSSSSASSSST